jgi:hypothetical protein
VCPPGGALAVGRNADRVEPRSGVFHPQDHQEFVRCETRCWRSLADRGRRH